MAMTMLAAAVLSVAVPAAPGREITIAGPQGALAGVYQAAGKGAPVVVIIPGSGPTDRDGNNPLGITASSYRMLAEALAAKGVASIRIDKRGMFGSKAAVPDGNKVTIAEYASDARKWAAEATRLTGAKCAWLAGHSEGALVALAAAQTPGLCGVVSIAGAGRPIGTIMRAQLRANPANAPLLDDALAAIDALEKGGSVDVSAKPRPLQMLFSAAVQPYFRDLFSYDPARLAATAKGRLLIVQGGRDLQVSVADAEALKAARPDATLAIAPNANHVLKSVPDDRAANQASYGDSSLPIDPAVVDAVAAFVLPGGR
ncbi:alpha/beta hydrolase [Sphingomonas sinipercae]|nr:alpha/beta fold hydrolase [Sphingomonas sinipercae]